MNRYRQRVEGTHVWQPLIGVGTAWLDRASCQRRTNVRMNNMYVRAEPTLE